MEACSLPLPYKYSKYLFYSSFLIGISSFVSLYYQDILTFLFLFIMFLSSIRFWYKPEYGWIRDIDMCLCKIISLYFFGVTLYFYGEYYQTVYLIAVYELLFLYACELICYAYESKKWIIYHMAIHIYLSFWIPFILYVL
jgi:hypothetical protein